MNLQEVLELIQLRPFERDSVQRMLNRVHSPDDFRAIAKRKLPKAVFDYVDGGADEEIAMQANRDAFKRRKLRPQLLRDVSVTDLAGELFGQPYQVPIGLAPTGLHAHDAPHWRGVVVPRREGQGHPVHVVDDGHHHHRRRRRHRSPQPVVPALRHQRPTAQRSR